MAGLCVIRSTRHILKSLERTDKKIIKTIIWLAGTQRDLVLKFSAEFVFDQPRVTAEEEKKTIRFPDILICNSFNFNC